LRISPATSFHSSLLAVAAAPVAPCLPAGGLSTHRITKNPIINMTRSAKVKIHSGHSSHSALFLHLVQPLDMVKRVHRGDAENAEKHYSSRFNTRRLIPSLRTGTLKLM